ncbi:MBL fold metallo-hydrolase [Chitinophaga sp. GCM10012297]|uniref:MBL fold metallo-hydrolase n=1 Tax=Chitinophaga chungangae TaxID=2821488 RepID=A0ABS3YGR9_9BACT|nr:MBL fold metallo-hydrolase [Chitinophaga chungangae]MBO9153887.1 MBL fold metallo-hydrolase [Chitinophaga chungangae]
MSIRRITENVYELQLGKVNAFLLEDEKLTLIDTGVPDSTGQIIEMIREVGRQPEELKHILLTHSHPDHAGSAAQLKMITGAKVYMHAAEKMNLEKGFVAKPPVPYFTSLANKLMYNLFIKNAPGLIPSAKADVLLQDGDWLPIAGGLHAIHIPGHSAGQLAFFLPGRKNVLFAADAADNLFGLGYSCFYENFTEAERSLERLSTFDFDIACFGHGKSIMRGASERFRNKFLKHKHKAPTVKEARPYLVVEKDAIVRIQEPEEKN